MNDEAIHSYFDAINAEDWTALGRLWHPNASLKAVGARIRKGPEEILAFYQTLFRSWAKHTDSPSRILPSGDSATVEVVFTGVTVDGRDLSFDAVDIFDLSGTRILKLSTWYDLVAVRAMLAGSDVQEAPG